MDKALLTHLRSIVGAKSVLDTPEDLTAYSYDGTFSESLPGAIVLPETTEHVSQIVKFAAEFETPIVARGMGSGLAAGSVPLIPDSLVISFTRMNQILEIDTLNATVQAQAGVVTADLQAEVEEVGLYYPPDPSSIRHSTIGGNIACNAGGPRCLKYGVTGDYVLGLTVVLADGQILKTGGKPIKNVTGYDLTALFTGSEGTLGLVTEALLRLIARPKHFRTILVEFNSIEQASLAVNAILHAGVVPCALELMDQSALSCIEEAMHLGLSTDIEASLIIEVDGSSESLVQDEITICAQTCRENGARTVQTAKDEAQRADLWKARRLISPSLARIAPNKVGEDITVPRSAIPEVVKQLREISARHKLPIAIFGHAGDGNLHPNILFDKRDPSQWRTAEQMVAEIFNASLSLGGTLSGEHGVGDLKRPYLEDALGKTSIDVQRSIKSALDPKNLLNPGKIFPVEAG